MTICPKCRHVRSPDATVPDWQCPACGVAYIKAAALNNPAPPPIATVGYMNTVSSERAGIPWLKVIVVAALVYGAWVGIRGADDAPRVSVELLAGQSEAEVRAIAAKVKPGEVLMYTTTRCPYCSKARAWLDEYGFSYTECNTETREACATELRGHGGDGVPYLIVRGERMRAGFDTDRFLTLLSQ